MTTNPALTVVPMRKTRPLRVLVAIACYGTKNLELVRHVIDGWKKMPFEVHIVVLSDAPKEVRDDVEVLVGLPCPNPWSLPFAHKSLFAKNVADYDVFAYSEDDMEVRAEHVQAFLEVGAGLADDEVAGFLRYEVDDQGAWSYPDAHAHFHWKPESVRRRGDNLVAEFSNEHAAFYLLTRHQLERAIASGGFLREPYEGRYDMLCAAATDPYTSCGFRKVVCVSRLREFSIHHLSDRYVRRWCVPLEDLMHQIRAQQAIVDGTLPASRLLPTESRMTQGEWSKCYYEEADPRLTALVSSSARTVLSVGCGAGEQEREMQAAGFKVTALLLDAVIGATAVERGIEVIYGTLDEAIDQLRPRRFDCVVISNLLHLAPDPDLLLSRLAGLLTDQGSLVARGPNFDSLRIWLRRLLHRGGLEKLRSFRESGVHRIGPSSLARQLKRCGMQVSAVRWKSSDRRVDRRLPGRLGAVEWTLCARRKLDRQAQLITAQAV